MQTYEKQHGCRKTEWSWRNIKLNFCPESIAKVTRFTSAKPTVS